MSVREGERQESNLKYIQDAEKLCAYTLQICNNPNHFPEPVLANQMKEEAIQMLCNLRYNLSAYTLNKKDTKTLFKYQLAAMAHLDALQSLLGQAYDSNFYHIDSKSVEYWIGLIINTEESIKKLGLIPIC